MNLTTEPAAIAGLAGAVIAAGLALLTAFGLSLTAGQTSAIMGAVSAVSALVLAAVVRSKVTPVPAPPAPPGPAPGSPA